jgi:hypothetical protein
VAGVFGLTDDVVALPPPASGGVSGYSLGSGGVFGASVANPGVAGVSTDFTGIFGTSFNGSGVRGESTNYAGVLGVSGSFYGVWGSSTAGPGVYGFSSIDHAVHGESDSSSGIVGFSGTQGPAPQLPNLPNIAGVKGTSDQSPGVIGTSNAAIGVYGFSSNNAGIVGQTGNAQSYAGYFAGNLMVTGQIFAGVKDAIVPFPDGSKRVLHCMESPEHWFEDFGAGTLKRGRAVVKLDGDFAKVIKRGDYHVFLTPRGDCRGLYVRSQGGASFEVRELAGGSTSSVAFSYRIVGRRKDIKGHRRFTKIDTRLSLPVPRARKARPAPRMKMPPPTSEGLRAFATRMQKEARAQMRKRGRKGKRS